MSGSSIFSNVKVDAFWGEEDTETVEEYLDKIRVAIDEKEHKEGKESVPEKPRTGITGTVWFNVAVQIMTLLNTLAMGLEADQPEWTDVWMVCENIFTAGFFTEMIIKIYCLRWRYFKDKANWLDGFLTMMGVADCWILSVIPVTGGNHADLQSLSILRILRLLRLARVLKLARSFKPLVLVIQGVLQAVFTTVYVFALLIFIFYVFAMFLTEHMGRQKDTSVYPGFETDIDIINQSSLMVDFNPYLYFGSMAASMFTLFNMAILAEWNEVVRPIALKQPAYVLVFLVFGLLVAFGVMNVMIGVIVDSVIAESKKIDQEFRSHTQKERIKVLEKLQILMHEMDTDGDGCVSIDELGKSSDAFSLFSELVATVDLPTGWSDKELMHMLDNSGDGVLQKAEFAKSFYRLMETDDFQQLCIIQASINQVKNLVRTGHRDLKARMDKVERRLEQSQTETRPASQKKSQAHRATHGKDMKQNSPDEFEVQTRDAEMAEVAFRELRERIERISHEQLMETLDAAFVAMSSYGSKLQSCVKLDHERQRIPPFSIEHNDDAMTQASKTNVFSQDGRGSGDFDARSLTPPKTATGKRLPHIESLDEPAPHIEALDESSSACKDSSSQLSDCLDLSADRSGLDHAVGQHCSISNTEGTRSPVVVL